MTFSPEITKGDPLYELIFNLVVEHKPEFILEIGSGNGLGSTQAFIEGIEAAELAGAIKMFCIEANRERCYELMENTRVCDYIKCINASSVPVEKYMSEADIEKFWRSHGYQFNIIRQHSVETVKKWREDELKMIKDNDIDQNGIQTACKNKHSLFFDMVLIDGSAFTGSAELDMVNCSKIIIMDDTMDIKCLDAMKSLINDKLYKLLVNDRQHRNGFAAFGLR